VQHLKLPHYVDFQAELNLIRRLRQNAASQQGSRRMSADSAPPGPIAGYNFAYSTSRRSG